MSEWTDYNGDAVHDMYTDSMYGEGPYPFGESRADGGNPGGGYRYYGGGQTDDSLSSKIARCQARIEKIEKDLESYSKTEDSYLRQLRLYDLGENKRRRIRNKLDLLQARCAKLNKDLDNLRTKRNDLKKQRQRQRKITIAAWSLLLLLTAAALALIHLG